MKFVSSVLSKRIAPQNSGQVAWCSKLWGEINFSKMRILNFSKWDIKIYGYSDLKRKLFKLPKNNWFNVEIKKWTFAVCYSNFGPYINLEICCQRNLNVCYSNVCPYINSQQTYVTEKFFTLSLYFHISQSVCVQFFALNCALLILFLLHY